MERPFASTQAQPVFTYQPKTHPDFLRVLKVLPERFQGYVQISLNEVEWSSTTYRCLSYTWGDQSEQCPIRINGRWKHVGKSLHDFLESATSMFPNEAFWIDAICINQDDIAEKGVEVQRMGRVFNIATEVIVWLGKDDKVNLLFNWGATHEQKRNIWRRYMWSKKTIQYMQDGRDQLDRHPYWTCAWITQEIWMAQKMKFVCGITAISTLQFQHCSNPPEVPYGPRFLLYEIRMRRQDWSPVHPWILETKLGVSGLETAHWPESCPDFWTILVLRLHAKCMDPRDRIYSLLALSAAKEGFAVDYKETLVDLFWRFADFISAWTIPFHLSILWRALGLTEDDLLRAVANNAAAYRIIVPLYARRAFPNQGGSLEQASTYEENGCCCKMGFGDDNLFRIKGYEKGDLLLCSAMNIEGDRPHCLELHVLIRRSESCVNGPFLFYLQCGQHADLWSADCELWYKEVENDEAERRATWNDVVQMTVNESSIRPPQGVEALAYPQLVPKLSHHYVLQWCVERRHLFTIDKHPFAKPILVFPDQGYPAWLCQSEEHQRALNAATSDREEVL